MSNFSEFLTQKENCFSPDYFVHEDFQNQIELNLLLSRTYLGVDLVQFLLLDIGI